MNGILNDITLRYQTQGISYSLPAGKSDNHFQVLTRQSGNNIYIEINPLHSTVGCQQLSIEIQFKTAIRRWRNHNYRWVSLETECIANEYSPKILQLSDGSFVQAGQSTGCWEVQKDKDSTLQWHYHIPGLKPVFFFDPHRVFYQPVLPICEPLKFSLLLTKKRPLEWSRSPIPFSAIFCITDHCDFDSLLLLKEQRKLLKEAGLRISKGIFLNHYSKRNWNAAYEKPEDKAEIQQWGQDGHEVFLHSLSQSIKSKQIARDDFDQFQVPENLLPVHTWVDHGYQPYNFTMQKSEKEQKEWLDQMSVKGLSVFWNYYDTFEDVDAINQISAERFCPAYVFRLKTKWSEKLRLLLYYQSAEKNVFTYRKWAGSIKSFAAKPSLPHTGSLLRMTGAIIPVIIKQLAAWLLHPKRAIVYAKYAPLIFEYPGKPSVQIFQTIAIKSYTHAFAEETLDDFVKNSGVCIAHTYLASMEQHHTGRLFTDESGQIEEETRLAWMRMGRYIRENQIWNPTIHELAAWMRKFSTISFSSNEAGDIIYLGPDEIPVRTIDD